MRQLFLVITKIFGLVMLYQILDGLRNIGFMISILLSQDPDLNTLGSTGTWISLMISVGMLVLSIGLTWLLLVRTKWVAKKLGIEDEDEAASGLWDSGVILNTGIQLMGLYIIAQGVPRLAIELGFAAAGGLSVGRSWTGIFVAILQLKFWAPFHFQLSQGGSANSGEREGAVGAAWKVVQQAYAAPLTAAFGEE